MKMVSSSATLKSKGLPATERAMFYVYQGYSNIKSETHYAKYPGFKRLTVDVRRCLFFANYEG